MGLSTFPDGSVFPGADGDFFGANGGRRDSAIAGTMELTDRTSAPAHVNDDVLYRLHQLHPVWTSPTGSAQASMHSGFLDAAPNGADNGAFPAGATFDRDYAGGGPVYFDRATSKLIMIYHGEFHPNYPNGNPFYTSLGLAISADKGKSFRKLGIVIRPEVPPTTTRNMASSSGTLVKVGEYFYLYYSDMSADGTCDGVKPGDGVMFVPCAALARAKVNDVVEASVHGRVAPWKKYYHGEFSEPGNGGHFSP